MSRLRHLLTASAFCACLPLAWGETVIQGDGSTFILTFDDAYNASQQAVISDAAQFWADHLRSDVDIEIDVQAVTYMNCNFSYNSHIDTQPPVGVLNFPNAPLANTYYPIALANALAGVDLRPNEADITLRLNRKMLTHTICPKWYLGKDENYSFIYYNLYFETLQEMAHGLGLMPMGDLMSGEPLNGTPDIYWTHLKSEQRGKMLTEMTAAEVDAAAHTANDLAFKGEISWEAAADLGYSRTSDALLLFARTYDAEQLTGLHLHESSSPKQIMMVDLRGAIPETDIAVAMLEDLGWVSTRNAVPVIESQSSLSLPEDSSLTLSLNDFVVTDEDLSLVSLSVAEGDHYSVNGLTITPQTDFFGTLQVPVSVSDGELTSEIFIAEITVTPVNDVPVVTSQQTLTLQEDSTLALSAGLFSITDVDSANFTINVGNGANYTATNNTLTPALNFYGELNVPVTVNDGIATSTEFVATVTVSPVNDAPVITSQQLISIEEEAPLAITTDLLTIADVDSSTFTIEVSAGANYSVVGNTISPAENFNGELNIPVRVFDGADWSAAFDLQVTVIAKNDPPVLIGFSAIEVEEDSTLELSPSLLQFTDEDSSEFFVVAAAGENYSINGNRLIPAENFFGTLRVPMQISDTTELSNTLLVDVMVTPVNDAPELSRIAPQFIAEDTSLFISTELLDIVDPDSSSFTVSIERGDNYQVAGNEIIPDANWFGEIHIAITVNDGELDSNMQLLSLNVSAVNDLPLLTTESLPNAHIYRELTTELTASDIDNDTLTYSLKDAPAWVTISESGVLSAFANENMIGDHVLEIGVNDGSVTIYQTLTLTVLDDPTATELSISLETERTIWATEGWVPVEITLNNHGPMASVTAFVDMQFDGSWQTQDAHCDVTLNQCVVDLADTSTLQISVQQTFAGSSDIAVTLSHDGFEIQPDDNEARLTLTFTDGTPVSPQYTVPSFGQGTVRAIGIANIQGGRWPEIMFANGPTEASTAYRFERSLFRPVLHSHLADASDSYGMALVDLDNDGDKDWVLANGNGEGNTVYLNNGEGYFELVDLLGNFDSRAVAFGDLDRDGFADLVFANNDDPNTIYLNDGDGTFTLYKTFESRKTRGVLIHDFNHDGRPDIIFANRGFRNRLLFNRGIQRPTQSNMMFKAVARSVTTSSEFDELEFGHSDDLTAQITLADLDGDGIKDDLVAVNEASDVNSASLQVFKLNEDETTTLTTHTETGSVTDVSVGDYDGDGKDDLAVLRPGGALEVMAHQGGQLNTVEVMDTDGADTILLVDVDGSGQADVISANNKSASSRLDFAGDVVNDESSDSGSSIAIPLPEVAEPAQAQTPAVSSKASSRGGAGLPLLILPLLLLARRFPISRD